MFKVGLGVDGVPRLQVEVSLQRLADDRNTVTHAAGGFKHGLPTGDDHCVPDERVAEAYDALVTATEGMRIGYDGDARVTVKGAVDNRKLLLTARDGVVRFIRALGQSREPMTPMAGTSSLSSPASASASSSARPE